MQFFRGKPGRVVGIFVAAGISAGAAYWYFAVRLPPVPNRVLRIGFEQVPPWQVRTEGGFAGLAVDAVREAARRAGIRLQWVETSSSSDEAFQKGLVDLWPLMVDLPSRRRHVHFSRPWMPVSHVLLLPARSQDPAPTFAGTIALHRMPLHVRLLSERYPQARLIQLPDFRDAVRQVCNGTAGAAFLEGRMAVTVLRESLPECAATRLRVQALPEMTFNFAVASTFDAAGAADRIRREIGAMFTDGTLAVIMARYSQFDLEDSWATYDLMQAAERARWAAWGVGLGSVALFVSLCLAVSLRQRRRIEAALRESEERFRTIADAAPVMICSSGPDKLATFFNDGWLSFTGRTMEQELGSAWLDGVHPEDRDRAWAAYSSSFDSRGPCNIEFRLRRADGQYRSVLCQGVPRFGPNGVFAGYIGCGTDITDLRRAQEELLATQKLESLGVLAAGIAHDFNNLLGSITANAELAVSELPAGSPAGDGIESIKAVAERAAGIVRRLMDYAGQEPVAAEAVDLSRLVGDLLDLLRVSIPKHVSLDVDLGENLPAVHANAAQIRQVILNLVTNAAEAIGSNQAGSIRVGVSQARSNAAAGTEGGSSLRSGDCIRLVVADTGGGMTQEVQSRIFDPFFTTKFTGRGLGLSAVQGIVRAHGGAIHVASAPGHGTRFEVLLPCAAGPAPGAGAAEPAAARESVSVPGTILVLEDEEVLRTAVCRMLRRIGFQVLEAGDGCSAIALFRERSQDIPVILLDMTIPGSPSHEVAAEARRIRPDVRVILTTAYSREVAAAAFADVRIDGYLRKPYRIEDLVRTLSELPAY